MRTMDCTDIKVLLSGLIDDELDADTRHAAERHVAECAACRAVVDEAESLSQIVRAEAELTLMPDRLPAGFAGAVLSRTVYDGAAARSRATGWMNWVGWFAAAAALMLALTIWVMDRRPMVPAAGGGPARVARAPQEATTVAWRTPGQSFVYEDLEPAAPAADDNGKIRIAPDRMQATVTVGAPGELFFSSVADEAPPPRPPAATPSILRDDADAIDAAAMLLDMLLAADDRSFADLEQIRRIAEYDDLLPRLAAARRRLDPHDRPAVFAAESILLRIVNGPVSRGDVQELRETVRQCDLPAQLAALTGRRDMMLTL